MVCRSKSASVTSSTRWRRSTAATWASAHRSPSPSTADRTSGSIAPASARSNGRARWPSPSRPATVASNPLASRSRAATRAPAAAIACAVARPMPLAAPVTITPRPSRPEPRSQVTARSRSARRSGPRPRRRSDRRRRGRRAGRAAAALRHTAPGRSGTASGTTQPCSAAPSPTSPRIVISRPCPLGGGVRDRHRRDQRLGVGMPRIDEQLVGRRGLHHLAAVHHHDPVAHVAHERQVVRDVQVGEAVLGLQTGEQVEDLTARRHVERGHGLVGDDDLGPGRQGAGDGDALALAARQLHRPTFGHLGAQADVLEQFGDPGRGTATPVRRRGAPAARR